MVDDSGRLCAEIRRKSSSENESTSLCKVVTICIVVSILVQCALPFIYSFFVSQFKKRLKPTENIIGNSVDVYRIKASYLVEPFPISRYDGVTSREIVRKLNADEWTVNPALESEALSALSAAKNALKNGNTRKCKFIMDHALALSPNHPDILAEYGAYLERSSLSGEDLIKADGFYTKSLAINPHQTTALTGRQRTRLVVDEIDENELKELTVMRDSFASMLHSNVVRRVMRESYFAHVYHTVAIEGNTLSLGETRSILETGMPISGKSLIEHNEVLGVDAALRYLNRSLIDKNGFTFERISRRVGGVAGSVNSLARLRGEGSIRPIPRGGALLGFTPVAASEVHGQMEELIEWLNSESTAEMDPVQRAAIAHYKLVLIHPFTDGNGRTSRLLMNLLLMKSGFPPVILPVEDKALYYATLHTANLGDLRPFVRFVAKHTRNTLEVIPSIGNYLKGPGHTNEKYLQLSSMCSTIECQQSTTSEQRIPTN
ncbi:fic-1 [Pristionchus pacificus]|uniref:protein adenylyltransferase n=1 Tax=Pristionchus pacificus TaxID=54126 RepID=A0A2A6BYV8_PRIPA|nr:fic-1 [Pristionchus pacificus]|eukprot:PDM71068.1 fic-1 [Pristionchus pacificus]